jgi:glycosyltransferase involved in cell wall biosynthesis
MRCIMHVTSQKEAMETLARMSCVQATVIPNGVEIPDSLPVREWQPGGRLRVVYLGRLHPIKGLENLIHAIHLTGDSAVNLSIFGQGDHTYTQRLRELVKELRMEERISFCGHVEGVDKCNAFMCADLCVIPSFTENFGMVVAEALAHAVPVVASRGTPWAQIEERGCGIWSENSPEALQHAIETMRRSCLKELGQRGRLWIQQQYTWELVAHHMCDLYQDVTDACA